MAIEGLSRLPSPELRLRQRYGRYVAERVRDVWFEGGVGHLESRLAVGKDFSGRYLLLLHGTYASIAVTEKNTVHLLPALIK